MRKLFHCRLQVFCELAVFIVCILLASLTSVSCAMEEDNLVPEESPEAGRGVINISGSIRQEYLTRANDDGFCDKDIVGIYIVNYKDNIPGELVNKGNYVDNLRFAYEESSNRWIPAYDVYWKDSKTHIDIYGYYPYGEPEIVSEYPFEVAKDQRRESENGKLGGYEASDFLWGKSLDIAPTSSVIKLGFKHRMSCVRIKLNRGFGFSESEWETAQKEVVILNTVRKSIIDLRTGEVSPYGHESGSGIIPYKDGTEYRGIVVPQTVASGKKLISVTIDGESYFLIKNEDFVYTPSKMHNFTVTVNKRSQEEGLDFVLSDESITPWENDNISHDAPAREYVVVDVKKAGTLDECLLLAGKDVQNVKNLKITGQINSRDFAVMKYMMPSLFALNLKEAIIRKGEGGYLNKSFELSYYSNEEDELPSHALTGCNSLSKIVLPDRLRKIEGYVFSGCKRLSGSIIIPEGVEEIGISAFSDCKFLDGELYLPSTLKKIGPEAFMCCRFSCELTLPEKLEHIDESAFYDCCNFYGKLKLPEGLKYLGSRAFVGCSNIIGSLEIPQGIKTLQYDTFNLCGFNGTLKLHDGIESIMDGAFYCCRFRGELLLPKNIQYIGENAFAFNEFSGELHFPEHLEAIGGGAFSYNSRLSGELVIPAGVRAVGKSTFSYCQNLESLLFASGLETVADGAFEGCTGIRKIVCQGLIPPRVSPSSFGSVPKDKFTVQVPESSVFQYRNAVGWKEFKYISSFAKLAVVPSVLSAINSETSRRLEIKTEREWYVESCPDWVTFDKTSGNGNAGIGLVFSQMPQGGGRREGEVVFALKDGSGVSVGCKVTQYDFEFEEDEFIALQRASKGGGINIVLLGDGYDAREVSEGKFAGDMAEAYLHFFDIEPYRTYKDYFNVYMGICVSAESGIGGIRTLVDNKFHTCVTEDMRLAGRRGDADFRYITEYICSNSSISSDDLYRTLVIIVPNTYDYSGMTYLWDNGFAISYCPMSTHSYPFDFRGIVQHEAGGHGFGKLGDETVAHSAFLDDCKCSCCGHTAAINAAKAKGWYQNLSLSGKISQAPWSHLISHENYSDYVYMFEGGFMHGRGVFRSEQSSCMSNNIPYYNAISRESIVRRIKNLSGEEFSFDDFVRNDMVISAASKNGASPSAGFYDEIPFEQTAPVIMD